MQRYSKPSLPSLFSLIHGREVDQRQRIVGFGLLQFRRDLTLLGLVQGSITRERWVGVLDHFAVQMATPLAFADLLVSCNGSECQ